MSGDALRVLIVDDDAVDRMSVRRGLGAEGVAAEFSEAADVDSALGALGRERFDCVFLDYQLPGGDGLKVLTRARAAGIATPIVVLTGRDDGETVAALMKAGASDYLNKNAATSERLAHALRYALRVHEAEEQAQRAQEELRRSEARFRVLHETSPDAFLIFRSVRDDRGEIVDFECEYSNPAAERLAKREAAGLRGCRLLEVSPDVREAGLFELYRRVVESGEPQQLEARYGPEGQAVWIRVTAAKLEDGFAASFADITQRKEAEAERERAIAARNRFYAAMSHELRTPMNAILGYTDLLLSGVYGPLTGPQLEGVQRAHRAARHLLDLVNDVLDLSKLEAGKLEVQVEEVSLPQLLDELLATVGPLAEDRGVELRFVHRDCADPIVTDPRRVRQIMLNLLSNAVKFGDAKPVEVRCTGTADGGVVVEVVDRGKGIAPEDLPRIFEEFVQLAPDEQPGTGLGLPISKRLAELLGGSLVAESRLGEGSVFRMTLPNSPSLSPATAAVQSA